jgi:fibro-slime domain-containing protein
MDRFGLEDGQRYSIEFFYAKRHTTAESVFNMRTNMLLQSPFAALPMSSALFD